MQAKSLAFVAVCVLFTGAGKAAHCQKQKPKPPGLGAIGTSQMPGSICKFGQAYTLGKAAGHPFNLNILSAEYRATRVKTGNTFLFPMAATKLIVVRYTVHNPLPKEQKYFRNLKFTAVMPDMKNFESVVSIVEQAPNAELDQVLKPAQKISAYCIIEVPGEAQVDKLIVANQADAGSPVARYPLAGLVKKLEPAYADPKDPSGTTPLKVMKVTMGQTYEIGSQDIAVLKVEQVSDRVRELGGPAEGKVYVMVTYQATCQSKEGDWFTNFAGGWLESLLVDADGGAYGASGHNFRTSSVAEFDPKSNFGEPATFRKAYEVPKGVKCAYVRLSDHGSREIRVDLAGFTTG